MRTGWDKTGRAMLLIASLMLAACETVPQSVPGGGAPDAALVAELQQRSDWSARGNLGIWSDETANTDEQNITASVVWTESSDELNVVLRGPLGVGEMVLAGSAQGASLRRGNSTVTGPDPSTLVQQALNLAVPVPLAELSSWMRGLPGSATDLTYDESGRLQTLRYVDATGVQWRTRIRRYTTADSLQVPSLITAVGGPYNIRLVLRNWKLVPSNSDSKPSKNDSSGRLSIPGLSS